MKEMIYNSKRIIPLDILKGFGIILVVIGHFYDNNRVYNWIYSFHMPLFFCVSGYLFKKENIGEVFVKKFKSLMIPYFIFAILSQIYYILLEIKNFDNPNILEISWGVIWGTYGSIAYNKVLWFLPVLFCIVNIYNILMNICGSTISYGIVSVIAFLFILNILPIPNAASYLPWGLAYDVPKHIFFYMFGDFLAQMNVITKIRNCFGKRIFFLAIFLMVCNFRLSPYRQVNYIFYYLIAIIGVTGWLLFSVVIEKYGKYVGG